MPKSRNIRIILWTALLSTVFIVSPGLWDATVTGKYFYFALVVPAASLFTAYLLLRRHAALHICFTDIAVSVFAAWAVAGCIMNGRHPGMSLWLFMLLVPLYFVIRTSLQDRNMIRPLACVILTVVAAEAVWGLLQLYGVLETYHKLPTGSFFNSGPYAGFLACGVPLALYFILNGCNKAEKYLGLTCMFVAGLVLPASMSRAAWVAAVAGCIPVAGVFLYRRRLLPLPARRTAKLAAFIVMAVLVSGAFFALYSLRKPSADGRLFYWRVSAGLVREKPLTGHGLGSFQVLYDSAKADFLHSGKATGKQRRLAGGSPEYAFNEYVQVTVEHGITGLLLFLAIICPFFAFRIRCLAHRPPSQEKGDIMTAVGGSLAAFLVFAFFSYPFSVLPLVIIFVVLVAMSTSFSCPIKQFSSHLSGVTIAILCLGLSGYASAEILSRYPAYREWQAAQTLSDSGYCEQAVEAYSSLYPKLNRQPQYLFEYARCLTATGGYLESNELLDRYLLFGSDPVIYYCKADNYKNLKDYEKAENMYLRASEIQPGRAHPLLLLMNLYDETGQGEKAGEIFERLELRRKKR